MQQCIIGQGKNAYIFNTSFVLVTFAKTVLQMAKKLFNTHHLWILLPMPSKGGLGAKQKKPLEKDIKKISIKYVRKGGGSVVCKLVLFWRTRYKKETFSLHLIKGP